jgi:hypothetical protein
MIMLHYFPLRTPAPPSIPSTRSITAINPFTPTILAPEIYNKPSLKPSLTQRTSQHNFDNDLNIAPCAMPSNSQRTPSCPLMSTQHLFAIAQLCDDKDEECDGSTCNETSLAWLKEATL